MSCSSSTIGRLRRDGSERHAIACGRRTHHCRGAGVDRSAPCRGPRVCGRRATLRRLSPPGGRRACRSPMSADNRPSRLTGRPMARSSSPRRRPAPSSARRSKRAWTSLGRPRSSSAERSRPMRSKRRCATPPISAIRCSSSPTHAGRLTPSISMASFGRLRTCGRWRWRVSARPPPSSTPRQRFGPWRRPRRASAERRERADGATGI